MPKRFDSLHGMRELLNQEGFVVNGTIPVSQEEYDWYAGLMAPPPSGPQYDPEKLYFHGNELVVKTQ